LRNKTHPTFVTLRPLTTTSLPVISGTQARACPYCQSSSIVKKGKRRNKLQTLQLWQCKHCRTVFSPSGGKGSTYPLPVILSGLSYYNQGYSLAATARLLRNDFQISVPATTLSSWLADNKSICTYRRLREQIRKEFSPHQVIRSTSLYHHQVYNFRIHQGKLSALSTGNPTQRRQAQALSGFLDQMFQHCPHELFTGVTRASQLKGRITLDETTILHKSNTATRIARLVLPTVGRNIQRHEAIQKFMLINDSVTVAVEVPIYLSLGDVDHLETKLGLKLPFKLEATASGHIDFLQIRNGSVHILDYKPNARRERPFQQLLLYALALSRRTGLRLYDFKCAWFDENDYYEFFPLHLVHHPQKRRAQIPSERFSEASPY
jgi:hypothetical protein